MLRLTDGGEYRNTGIINEGVYAKVYRYINERERLAVKVVGKHHIRLAELDILTRLAPHCPYLLNSVEIIPDEYEVKIVTPEGLPYDKFFFGKTKLDPEEVSPLITNLLRIKFICELVWAVNFLHKNGVIHLDIKPHNCIFYPDGSSFRLRLGDFGFAQYLYTTYVEHDPRFSTKYEPNERILYKYDERYDGLDDVWTVGLTILRFLAVPAEFENDTDPRAVARCYEQVFHSDQADLFLEKYFKFLNLAQEYWADLKLLIKGCLAPRKLRININEALAIVERLANQIGVSPLPQAPFKERILPVITAREQTLLNTVVDNYLLKRRGPRTKAISQHHLLLTLDTFYRTYLVTNKEPLYPLTFEGLTKLIHCCECLIGNLINCPMAAMDNINLASRLGFKLYHPTFNNTRLDFESILKAFSRLDVYLATFYTELPNYPPRLLDAWVTPKVG